MFSSIKELIEISEKEKMPVYEIMIQQEMKTKAVSREFILEKMRRNYIVMKEAVEKGKEGVVSCSKISGGDGKKLYEYINKKDYITDEIFLKAICYAVGTNEVNAAMGLICATPTAGSAGVVPAVLFAVKDKLNLSEEDCLNFLFTASAYGFVIANNACISGAAGGCQAEVGSASAMAAAALVTIKGGTPSQAADALAISLKNMMGLICDPVAGLVEVPCIKRNAAGATLALCSAEMALAGITSIIPPDEVIETMNRVGSEMDPTLRETALGGLAITKTGIKLKEKVFGCNSCPGNKTNLNTI